MNAGVADSGQRKHICWSYEERSSYEEQARAYLAQGLAAGERVWYAADGDRQSLIGRLSGIDGFAAALDSGAADVFSIQAAYAHDSAIDPECQVRAYRAATEAALADGYRGLRVAADVTSLVRSAAQLDAFARYEHLIDRYMRDAPMSAMCAYSRAELGADAVAQVACMHPATNAEDVLFRLHADEADAVALGGELDVSNRGLFAKALTRADLRPAGGSLVIEAPRLTFIDHRCLIELREYARHRGAQVVLRTPRTATARLARLLDLTGVQVEAA